MHQVLLLLLMVALSSPGNLAHVIDPDFPTDCEDIYNIIRSSDSNASVPSGVYTIYPSEPDEPVKVYCDMGCADSSGPDNKKWTVIQRRINGSVSFYRDWEQYKNGFGDVQGEYWLGLENIYLLTYREKYLLKVEMEDFEKGSAYAQYSLFYIDPESSKYKLNIGGYINGGAGDSLSYVNGRSFSTYDNDSSGSCAEYSDGGFWFYGYYWYYYYYYYGYGYCTYANPNGLYKHGNTGYYYYNTGITWYTWKGYYYSMKTFVMKIRRISLEELEEL